MPTIGSGISQAGNAIARLILANKRRDDEIERGFEDYEAQRQKEQRATIQQAENTHKNFKPDSGERRPNPLEEILFGAALEEPQYNFQSNRDANARIDTDVNRAANVGAIFDFPGNTPKTRRRQLSNEEKRARIPYLDKNQRSTLNSILNLEKKFAPPEPETVTVDYFDDAGKYLKNTEPGSMLHIREKRKGNKTTSRIVIGRPIKPFKEDENGNKTINETFERQQWEEVDEYLDTVSGYRSALKIKNEGGQLESDDFLFGIEGHLTEAKDKLLLMQGEKLQKLKATAQEKATDWVEDIINEEYKEDGVILKAKGALPRKEDFLGRLKDDFEEGGLLDKEYTSDKEKWAREGKALLDILKYYAIHYGDDPRKYNQFPQVIR